ncbi:MAG: TonB-dependent receptor [Alphaproteobacteria bacterium]
MDDHSTLVSRLKLSAAALAVSGVALTGSAALAQGDTPTPVTVIDEEEIERSGAVQLETIIVETKGGAKDLQSAAFAATAVSGEALKRTFAQDLRDISALAPNVSLEPVGIFQNSASFYIRGLGTADIESAADPVVAVLVDGIYQARVSTALSDFLDISTVQVLRGPQGTEFGHNSTAGVVTIEHNAPDLDEFGVSGSVLAGDFGRLDVKGVVNVPIAEGKVAGRLAFKSTNFDGYWRNSLNGEKRGGHERLTILPSIRFQPNDNLDIVIRGEYARIRDDTYPGQSHNYCRTEPGSALFGIFPEAPPPTGVNDLAVIFQALYSGLILGQTYEEAEAAAAAQCGVPIRDLSAEQAYTFRNTEERGDFANNDIWGITGRVDYDIPDVGTITYVGNYREVSESIRFQIETTTLDIFAGQRDQEHYQTTHELRFASDLSETFDFVVGAYYFESDYVMRQQSYGVLFEPNLLSPMGGLPFYNPATSSQAGWSQQNDRAWAIFLNANYHITEQLTFTAGIRYTDQRKDFEHCGVGAGDPTAPFERSAAGCNNVPFMINALGAPFNPPGTIVPRLPVMQAYGFDASGGVEGGCIPVVTGNPDDGLLSCNNRISPEPASWTNISPTIKVSYQITDDAFAYAMWSRGFRSGGFNGRATTPTTVGPYDPERADNYEVGLKTEWFDRRLQFNLTGFWTIVDGLQQGFIRPSEGAGGQETVIANIGEVTNKGIEVDFRAIPVEGLTVFGSLGFIDSKQKNFCTDGDGFSGTDPNNPPPPAFDFQEVCADPEPVFNEIGEFLGWLVPTDNSNLVPGPRTPKWTLNAGFYYEFPVGNSGSITFGADWNYNSKVLISVSNASELDGVTQYNGDFLDHFRKSSHIFNANITWRDVEDRYRIDFFVKNITNEIHKQAVTNVGGLFEFRVPNVRRHWGVEISFDL